MEYGLPGRSRRAPDRQGWVVVSQVLDDVAEFQQVLGQGEVIAEAADGPSKGREIVLLVEWLRPLHVVIAIDSDQEEERLVTVYEPDPALWTADYRRRR